MNYQVASFVWQYIKKEGESNLKFVYSERESIWLFDFNKHNYQSLSPTIRLKPEEILNIQKVPFEKIKCDEKILEWLKTIGRKSPLSLKLGNIDFDDIYETKNFLTLIKFVDKNSNLDKVRRLIAFCGKNRQELKELHSFEVVIFTNDKKIQERFISETVGSVRVIYFDKKNKLNSNSLHTGNDSIFSSYLPKELIFSKVLSAPKCGPTLYLVMSPELTNTMTAIYSHSFSNLCLIYTPGDIKIERFINNIRERERGRIVPHGGGLQLIRTDITGFNLLKIEKFGEGK